jgi:DNA polymerase-3 subunit epsilon
VTRQIVLDTETTGLEPEQGHRIIEIGGVELINRKLTGNHFHRYVRPDREIDDAAFEVHGISATFLEDKPRFEEIAHDLIAFIDGAELIIHNAPFDVGFLDYEFAALPGNWPAVERLCKVTDSLALARHKHPGQKNNLDALCRRYMVDNSARALHGALLDAEILADVYLAMTGGQTSLFGQSSNPASAETDDADQLPPLTRDLESVIVVRATVEELVAHERLLDLLDERGGAAWRAV